MAGLATDGRATASRDRPVEASGNLPDPVDLRSFSFHRPRGMSAARDPVGDASALILCGSSSLEKLCKPHNAFRGQGRAQIPGLLVPTLSQCNIGHEGDSRTQFLSTKGS